MTLHVYNCEQRSDEWRALRLGKITASAIGELITPTTIKPANNDKSRGLIATLAAERVTGYAEDNYVNLDMWRGVTEEPRARDKYAETMGVTVDEVGFMVLERHGWQLGYSPDGLVGDDGLIEIKCPRAKGHLSTIVRGEVPAYYMAQLQTGLFVTGRKWIDYVSFTGGLPLFIKRVEPDEMWHAAIAEAVATCEAAIAEMVDKYNAAVVGLPLTERLELVVI